MIINGHSGVLLKVCDCQSEPTTLAESVMSSGTDFPRKALANGTLATVGKFAKQPFQLNSCDDVTMRGCVHLIFVRITQGWHQLIYCFVSGGGQYTMDVLYNEVCYLVSTSGNLLKTIPTSQGYLGCRVVLTILLTCPRYMYINLLIWILAPLSLRRPSNCHSHHNMYSSRMST